MKESAGADMLTCTGPQRDTQGPQALKRSRLGSTCRTATKRLLSFGLNTERNSILPDMGSCFGVGVTEFVCYFSGHLFRRKVDFALRFMCDNYIISKKKKKV